MIYTLTALREKTGLGAGQIYYLKYRGDFPPVEKNEVGRCVYTDEHLDFILEWNAAKKRKQEGGR